MGLGILERTRILSGIQITMLFIEFFVVESIRRYCTRDLDTANMRPALEQGCGKQTPSAGKLLSGRICYVFLISKCRGDRDLGLCTTSGLAFGEPQRNDKFRFFLRRNTFFFRKSPLRCGSPNASPEVVHRPRYQSRY